VKNAKPCVELNAQLEPDVPGFTGAQGLFEYFMKTHTLNQIESPRFQPMKNMSSLLKRALVLAGALAVLSGTLAQASITKDNNTLALTNTASWVGGVVPGPAAVARWDNTVLGANTVALGTNLAWSGIQIVNPGGAVTIVNDGNTLTNGLSGIDMSAATRNLALSNNVVLGTGPQNWTVASGRTLALGASLLRNQGGSLRFYLPDLTASGAQVTLTNGIPNWLLGGTTNSSFGNLYFATINDVDIAALNGSMQVVGESTIGSLQTSGLVQYNQPGTTPTQNTNCLAEVFNNTGSYGARTSGSYTYSCMLFNTHQTYNTAGSAAFYPVGSTIPAWQLSHTGGRNITVNAILISTNVGSSAVLDNGGGQLYIGNVNTRDLIIFQNNPAAPLVLQNGIIQSNTNTPSFLVKMGAGTVELSASAASATYQTTYGGGTMVYEGTLQVDAGGWATLGVSAEMPVSAFLGWTNSVNVYGGILAQATPNTNAIPITFFSGTTNDILINANGSQLVEGTSGRAETLQNSSTNFALTYSSGTRLQFVYSNSIVPSTTVAPLLVTNAYTANPLTANGTVTVDVLCGSLSVGQFPLISYSGAIGGSGPSAFVLGTIEPLASGYISNNTANSSIDLVITNLLQPIHWATGNGIWDFTTSNWKDNGGNPQTYQQIGSMGDNVSFDAIYSTGPSITVTNNANPIPASVTFAGANSYTLTGNGSISGPGSVFISGPSTTFIQTSNSFTGGLNINGGILNFSTLTNLGANGINFGGGTLQYATGTAVDISVRPVTFGVGGGSTIDLNGNAVTFANAVGNSGAGGFTLTGNNTLTINQTNRYSGNTIINSGSILYLGSTVTYINNSAASSAAIIVNGTLNAIVSALTLSTPQMLAGTGTVKGEIAMGSGTTISPATNGTIGTLTINGDLTINGGTLQMDFDGTAGTRDLIAINSTGGIGSGNLILNGGTINVSITGTALANGNYPLITYTGTLGGGVVNMTLTGFSQPGQLAYLASSSGVINMTVISGNTNSVVWVGGGANAWDLVTANWMVNGVPSPLGDFANGNAVTFNDSGSANPAVSLAGMFLPSAVTLNVSNKNYTFSGSGNLSGNTGLIINSATTNITTILTPNSNGGANAINGGTLQVGNGSVSGGIGSGNVTNNGTLIFDQTVNTVVAAISGSGKLIQEGSGTLTLSANNSYAGQTSISNASVLQVGTGGAAGSLGSGSVIDNGTLFFDVKAPVTVTNISGSGSVTFEPLTITLANNGTLTYQGNTLVTNGSLKLTVDNQIPNAVTVPGSTGIFGLGGTLDLNGHNQTVNGLTDLGLPVGSLITNSAATGTNVLTIGNGSINTTNSYSGLIMDNTNLAAIKLVILNPGTTILATNGNTYRGGTIVGLGTLQCGQGGPNIDGVPGTGTITMSNATTLLLGGNTITFVGNPVTIAPHSTVTFAESVTAGGSDTYSGLVSGDASSTNVMQGAIGNNFTFQGAGQWNGFFGTVLVPDGAGLRVYGAEGGTNTTFEIDGSGVLFSRGADVITLGALTGNGSITAPSVTPPATYVIGSKGVDSTFIGIISGWNNITKTGAGRLTLDGNTNVLTVTVDPDSGDLITNYTSTNGLTFTGNVTISNGVLAIVAPANLNGGNVTNFTLAGNTAVLDLSSAGYSPDGVTLVTNSTLTLASPQTLTGIGTIRGSVVAPSGVAVTVGFQPNTNGVPVTGLLTMTNSIELGGAVSMNISTTNVPNSGEISAPTITIDSGATLTVTNLGPAFQGGEVFHLFSGPVTATHFVSITLPAISSPLSWTNKLAIDGSIAILGSLVNTNSPYMTNTFDGTNLTLSWPGTGYIGYWRLQSQTNTLAVGLYTNWVNVANPITTNQMSFPVNRTNGAVFYRLIQP
jgi:autotransporter-associated beta strand protein